MQLKAVRYVYKPSGDVLLDIVSHPSVAARIIIGSLWSGTTCYLKSSAISLYPRESERRNLALDS